MRQSTKPHIIEQGSLSPTDLSRFLYWKVFDFLVGTWSRIALYSKARLLGIEIGSNVACWGRFDIIPAVGSSIRIGNNVSIVSSSLRCTAGPIFAPTKLRTWSRSSSIIIENGVGLNGTSITSRSKTITIGADTMIAPNVVIFDSDFHAIWPPENRLRNPAFENDADVSIGKNVWLGSSCMVMKGVTIGDNSVVAAGSVVTSNIPAGVLAAGVPARIKRELG